MADMEIQKFLMRNNVVLSSEDRQLLQRALQRYPEDNMAIETKDSNFQQNMERLRPVYDDGQVKVNDILRQELVPDGARRQEVMADYAVLQEKRAQVEQTQRRLDERRRVYGRDEAELNEQRAILEKQLMGLDESRAKFERFLRENEQKRLLYQHQVVQRQGEEQELREQQLNYGTLINALQLLARAQARENHKCRIYLDFVRAAGQLDRDYQRPEAIIKRFESLRLTSAQLTARLAQLHAELEATKAIQADSRARRDGEMVSLRSQLRDAEALLQAKQQRIAPGLQGAALVDRARIDYGSVLLGVNNLFRRVLDLSKRTDIAFSGMELGTPDVLARKIKVISEVIADLQRLRDTTQ